MTLGLDQTLPRWLIDDTAEIGHSRVFVVHTQEPRFIGEIVPESKADLDGIKLTGLPDGKVVSRIIWYDDPVFDDSDSDREELCRSLMEAITHHTAVTGP
jgi:hypothetical protein